MDSNSLKTDRISELPDPILEKILSLLPTKNAVGTCILSTRWKNVFPFGFPPLKLELDDSVFLNPERNAGSCTTFVGFVDKVLTETLRDVPCVDNFIMKCKKHYGDAKFMSWVCAAVRLNVRELRLECILTDSRALFPALGGCTTLTRLELKGKFRFIPAKFSIPNLKTLDMFNVVFEDDLFMENSYGDIQEIYGSIMKPLISGCPLLEELSLLECNMDGVEYMCIESKLLKKLNIQHSLGPSCLLVIITPNLDELLMNDCTAYNYMVSRLESLSWANIDVGPSMTQLGNYFDEPPWYFKAVSELVHGCCDTRELHLAACTMDCLHRSTQQLPTFRNLTLLYLACVHGSNGWEFLAHLLSSAPCLQKLIFEEGFKDCENGYSKFESAVSTPLLCLESHLKEIEIRACKEKDDQVKLIEYFLENGKALQTLKIYCPPLKNRNIMGRLRMLPKTLMVFIYVE